MRARTCHPLSTLSSLLLLSSPLEQHATGHRCFSFLTLGTTLFRFCFYYYRNNFSFSLLFPFRFGFGFGFVSTVSLLRSFRLVCSLSPLVREAPSQSAACENSSIGITVHGNATDSYERNLTVNERHGQGTAERLYSTGFFKYTISERYAARGVAWRSGESDG